MRRPGRPKTRTSPRIGFTVRFEPHEVEAIDRAAAIHGETRARWVERNAKATALETLAEAQP